jgi:hypothetical protein
MQVASRMVAFAAVILVAARPSSAQNPILQDLVTRGVQLPGGAWLRLPPPTLTDEMNAETQRQRIEAVAEERYTWEDLTRRSVMAPFILRLPPDDSSDGSPGRRVDLWFVAYGNLDYFGSEEFLSRQFETATQDTENVSSARLLKDSDLQRRQLPIPSRPEEPRLVAAEITLFEKVRVSATTCTIKTCSEGAIVLASVLDRRFTDDPDFPNLWRPIARDENGNRSIGAPQPYLGLGSYVKATRLAEPRGALLIEYHVAYCEPSQWFDGANLLRSKLPIVAQTAIRSLRKSLQRVNQPGSPP